MIKILVCVPCYGGLVYHKTMLNIMEAMQRGAQEGLFVGIYTLGNESLIPRGRNTCVHEFLTARYKWDRLFFIDADLSFTYEQFKLVAASPEMLVGGTYPVKTYPLSINFDPLPEHTTKYFSQSGRRSVPEFEAFCSAEADESGLVEVGHLPTGFMCIRREAFSLIEHDCETYAYPGYDGTLTQHREFFKSGATDGQYYSEDWLFCELARQNGIVPYLQTKAVLPHAGSHEFSLNGTAK